jgi:histidyl-tRNA synthetase
VLGKPRLYLVPLGEAAQAEALALARAWVRDGVPVDVEIGGRSLKSALKRADKDSFAVVAILGDDELACGSIALRDLARSVQDKLPPADVPAWWRARFGSTQ